MRDRRLADVAAVGEVAGAGLDLGGQLADDGQSGRVGQRGQEPDIGVDAGGSGACHGGSISVNFDIDKNRYTSQIRGSHAPWRTR